MKNASSRYNFLGIATELLYAGLIIAAGFCISFLFTLRV